MRFVSAPFALSLSLLWATQLCAQDALPPTVIQLIPEANATVRTLTSMEIFFSEDVSGVEASDLVIQGQPAEAIRFFGAAHYVFEFSPPTNGPVEIEWIATHGIRDLASNDFAGGSWEVILDPRFGVPNVVISEFMAANSGSTKDGDGDSSDWIELFNAGAVPVDLAGWFLTDSTNDLIKWVLPAVVMPPNNYLLVWASGKNRSAVPGELHSNFKLDKAGEYLALVGPETNVVSEFTPVYPGQEDDISYGRDPTDPALTGFYSSPTPGRRNTTSGLANFAPEIVFSTNSGTFVRPFALSLSLKTNLPNTVIRYSLGTALPTSNSTIYTGPINIGSTMQVRARAFTPGLFPSEIRSEQYIQIHSNVLAFGSTLPLMILHNNGGGSVPSSSDQFVMVQTFQPVNGRSSLTNVPNDRARGIFHRRGSSTLGFSKSSFFLETQDEFGNDQDETLLGLPGDSDWVLYAPNDFDPVLMHNPVGYEIARRMGRYASRTRFVVVFLKDDNSSGQPVTTNDYNGIYVLQEKAKINSQRVDAGKLEATDLSLPDVSGGYLLSIDRASPGESQFTGAGQRMNFIDPHYAEITLPQRDAQEQYIINYFNQFGTALNGANWTNPISGYAAFIDVDSWIDYNLTAVVTRNVDAIELSTYLYKPRHGKICFGPAWDFDRSQGGTDGRDFGPRVWNCGRAAGHFTHSWWGRLFTDPNFWQRWIDRYEQLRQDSLSTTNLYQIIESFAVQIRPEHPRELARWDIRPRSGNDSGCGFSHNFGSGGYEGEVTWLKLWYSNRFDFIDSQLLRPPVFQKPAGMVESGSSVVLIAPTDATIYYTLDGSDPRAVGGAIGSNARVYSGPIIVADNVRIVARSRNSNHSNATGGENPRISSPWSGLCGATFFTQLPELLATEIMYHAHDVPIPGPHDPDDFDYLELKNTGPTVLALDNMKFTNGLQFSFTNGVQLAPGAYGVLVKNVDAFRARYPDVTNIIGQFAGTLDNGGERLYLAGPFQEPVLDFVYADSWEPTSDGNGYSLTLRDESISAGLLSSSNAWRRSSQMHGSPGRADPALDTDGDSLPDEWELTQGTDPLTADAAADPDGDGMTNLQEYIAGTSPIDALSVLRLNINLAGEVNLSFYAISNRPYCLLFQSEEETDAWQTLSEIAASPTNRWVTVPDPPVAPQRIYRLFLPALP